MNDLALLAIKIGIIVGVVVLFIVITIINMKTKKPEGCEEQEKSCDSCTISCINRTKNNE